MTGNTSTGSAAQRVRCNLCGTVPPPRGAGHYCPCCAARLQGISLSTGTDFVFLEVDRGSPLVLEVRNGGQTRVNVSQITLIDRYANTRTRLAGEVSEPFEPGVSRQLDVEISGTAITSGTYAIEVATKQGVAARMDLRLVPLPKITVSAESEKDGSPVMLLAQEVQELSEGDGSGQQLEPARRWGGTFQLAVQPLSNETVRLQSVEVQLSGRTYPVVLGDQDAAATAWKLPVRLQVDPAVAEQAREEFLRADVSIRIVGYPREIVRSFQVSRMRQAHLTVEWKELLGKVAAAPHPEHAQMVLMHGMGRRIQATLRLGNDGDLEVEVAGPLISRSEAVRITDAAALQGRSLRVRAAGQQAVEREAFAVVVEPDRLAFESYPLVAGSRPGKDEARVLRVELSVPVRDPKRPGQEGRIESMAPYEIILRRATVEYESCLCIDLGTTNTCVAFVRQNDTEPKLLDVDPFDSLGNEYPSIVYFRDHERQIYDFGAMLRETMFVELKTYLGTAAEFKPHIGRNPPRFYSDARDVGREVRPRESAEIYLRWVLKEIRRLWLVNNPGQIHLACPVDFDSDEKAALQAIVTRALGVEDVSIEVGMSEPEALLVDMISTSDGFSAELPDSEPKVLAMFDFGGGTTDLLVQKVTLVRGAQGQEGDKLDRRFLQKITFREAGEELTRQLAARIWPAFRAALLDAVESKQPFADIVSRFTPPTTLEEVGSLDADQKDLYRATIAGAEQVKRHYSALKDGAAKGGTAAENVVQNFRIQKTGFNLYLQKVVPMSLVDQVIDDFVAPKLDALVEAEKRLNTRSGARFDSIYLAGNSSRLRRVLELAQERFGADRVRYVGDKHTKEGVARGLAWASQFLKAIVTAESRFCLRVGDRILEHGKPHDLALPAGMTVEVLWAAELDAGQEKLVGRQVPPPEAIGEGGAIRVQLEDALDEIRLKFLDPTTAATRAEFMFPVEAPQLRSKLCYQLGQNVYLEGQRYEVMIQPIHRVAIKRMNAMTDQIEDQPVATFQMRPVLRPGLPFERLTMLLKMEDTAVVLEVFDAGGTVPRKILRQELES